MGHDDVANCWSGRWPTWKASVEERDGNQVKRGKELDDVISLYFERDFCYSLFH
jgi:hypothetical protein